MMAPRPVSMTQKELTGVAKAMQEAGVPKWSVEVVKPDGTRMRISAGEDTAPANNIDKMLGIA